MTTPRVRTLVSTLSTAALLAAPLALGACARGTSPATSVKPETAPARSLSIEFLNEGHDQVDVYLVNDKRQWRLGRVAPGALTRLSIPEESLLTTTSFARLVALADAPPSVQVARDPGATLTMAQPLPDLLSQRWTFWHPQLGSSRLVGAPGRVGRRSIDAARDRPAQVASEGERPQR